MNFMEDSFMTNPIKIILTIVIIEVLWFLLSMAEATRGFKW